MDDPVPPFAIATIPETFVAVPDIVPIKLVDVIEVNPVTDVTVPPYDIVVDPNIVVLLAN